MSRLRRPGCRVLGALMPAVDFALELALLAVVLAIVVVLDTVREVSGR